MIRLDSTIGELKVANIISTRMYNVCRKMELLSLGDIVAVEDSVWLEFRNSGKKTQSEAAALRKTYGGIDSNLSETDKLKHTLESQYPFLLESEYELIVKFHQETGTIPSLYIIEKFIVRTEDEKIKMVRDFYGLNEAQTCYSLSQMANARKLTTERVRQIVKEGIVLPWKLQLYVEKELMPSMENLIPADDIYWENLQKQNMLDESFLFTVHLVCSIMEGYSLVQLDESCNTYLVNRRLLKNVKLKGTLNEMCRVLELRRSKIKEYDIYKIMTSEKRKYHKDSVMLCRIVAEVVGKRYGVDIQNQRYVIASPNVLDISAAIEEILDQQGEPMSFESIWTSFKELYPQSNKVTKDKFRPYILRNPNIRAKGKTGIYVLKSWPNHFGGYLVDYLEYILRVKTEPVPFSELVELAREQFPQTSGKSISTLISMDHTGRFVVYKNGCVGLAENKRETDELKVKKRGRRQSFEARFTALKDFVLACRRLPLSSGLEEEQSLARWMANVEKNKSSISSDQYDSLHTFLDRFKDVPQNVMESHFLQMCDQIKITVTKTFEIPKFEKNPEEYRWFKKNLGVYAKYMDNRRSYFEDLLSYLRNFGFYFE
ncbi:MAG: hypothetical protein NC324_01100 [Bacteroides sp.]|nr:hypothetical protein [Bacteroides sp.]